MSTEFSVPGVGSTVGERIEWARVRAGLKKKDVTAAIGAEAPRYSAWIHPSRPQQPKPETIAALSVALDVSASWLASGHGPVDAAEADREAVDSSASLVGEIVRQVGRQADAHLRMQDRTQRLEALALRLVRAVIDADVLDSDANRELFIAALELSKPESAEDLSARLEQELGEALRLAREQHSADEEGHRGHGT